MIILIMGSQGSGKGTQAKLLAKQFNYEYFESGDALREEIKTGSKLGEKLDRIVNQEGKLVPDQIMIQIVQNWFDKIDFKKGLIFDGYPRNLEQYLLLEKVLAERDVKIDKAFLLKVSRDTSIRRLFGRRICPKCDLEFNLVTRPPRNDELCDQCETKLVRRQDDTMQVIETRLNVYERATQPLVDYVRRQGILEEVDGEGLVEEIHQDITSRLMHSQPLKK